MPPAVGNSKDETTLSLKEARQLETAFSDNKFRDLMSEYVAELSDPKHKEEQEAYMAQLESQKDLPPGKSLIWPSRYNSQIVPCAIHSLICDFGSNEILILNFAVTCHS